MSAPDIQRTRDSLVAFVPWGDDRLGLTQAIRVVQPDPQPPSRPRRLQLTMAGLQGYVDRMFSFCFSYVQRTNIPRSSTDRVLLILQDGRAIVVRDCALHARTNC